MSLILYSLFGIRGLTSTLGLSCIAISFFLIFSNSKGTTWIWRLCLHFEMSTQLFLVAHQNQNLHKTKTLQGQGWPVGTFVWPGLARTGMTSSHFGSCTHGSGSVAMLSHVFPLLALYSYNLHETFARFPSLLLLSCTTNLSDAMPGDILICNWNWPSILAVSMSQCSRLMPRTRTRTGPETIARSIWQGNCPYTAPETDLKRMHGPSLP